jgi:hypothetical protein
MENLYTCPYCDGTMNKEFKEQHEKDCAVMVYYTTQNKKMTKKDDTGIKNYDYEKNKRTKNVRCMKAFQKEEGRRSVCPNCYDDFPYKELYEHQQGCKVETEVMFTGGMGMGMGGYEEEPQEEEKEESSFVKCVHCSLMIPLADYEFHIKEDHSGKQKCKKKKLIPCEKCGKKVTFRDMAEHL